MAVLGHEFRAEDFVVQTGDDRIGLFFGWCGSRFHVIYPA